MGARNGLLSAPDTIKSLAWTTGTETRLSPAFHALPRASRELIAAHESMHRRQQRHGRARLSAAIARHPVYREMIELDAAIGSLAILAGREPRHALPDDPAGVAHWGASGHYWTSLCVMLTARLPVADAIRRAFFCQMPDQVLEFDAIAAAVDFTTVAGVSPGGFMSHPATPSDQRHADEMVLSPGYSLTPAPGVNIPVFPRMAVPLPWESDWSAAQRRLHARQVSTGLHCLTGRRGSDEVAFRSANARQYARDPVLFGIALHCFGDSYAHQVDAAHYAQWQARVTAAGIVSPAAGAAARAVPMSQPGYMYPPITGHAPTGHATDSLREHQTQYMAYVGALYDLVTGAFGGASAPARAGLLAGLRSISGTQFKGDDEQTNRLQSDTIRSYCYQTGLAPHGSLDRYRPESESARYWRNFHPRHTGMMTPEGEAAVFRKAREAGAAWGLN